MKENEERGAFVDFGYCNGWKRTPKLVSVCRGKNHPRKYEQDGKCVEKISCPICLYQYRIDSGD